MLWGENIAAAGGETTWPRTWPGCTARIMPKAKPTYFSGEYGLRNPSFEKKKNDSHEKCHLHRTACQRCQHVLGLPLLWLKYHMLALELRVVPYFSETPSPEKLHIIPHLEEGVYMVISHNRKVATHDEQFHMRPIFLSMALQIRTDIPTCFALSSYLWHYKSGRTFRPAPCAKRIRPSFRTKRWPKRAVNASVVVGHVDGGS